MQAAVSLLVNSSIKSQTKTTKENPSESPLLDRAAGMVDNPRWPLSSAPLSFCPEHVELGTKAASEGTSKQLGTCLHSLKTPRTLVLSAIIYPVCSQNVICKVKVIGR